MGLFSTIGNVVGSFVGSPETGNAIGSGLDSITGGGSSGGGGNLLSTVLSYLGGQDANSTNIDLARSANTANQASADKQMAFQDQQTKQQNTVAEYLSGTAYRRAMLDMKLAGLNPMLAYQQGGSNANAASVQSGSSAHNTAATVQDVLTPALNSGRQTAAVNSTIQQQAVQNQNIQSQTKTNQTQQVKNLADAKLSATSAKTLEAGLPKKLQDTRIGTGFLGRASDYSDKIGNILSNTIGHLNPFTSSPAVPSSSPTSAWSGSLGLPK